ncbi:MAG TPA: DUF4124 domain-containing protein [Gammaproteobacteria bacterium]|nr:DUF4124 domain-containing protein [Gammaproteobacteria bacterium]
MRRSTGLLLALLVGTAGTTAQGAIYKWTDSQGGVHYSQQPPSGAKAQHMRPAPPPAEDPDTVRSKLKSRVDAMNKQQGAHDKAAKKKQEAAQKKARRDRNCRAAHANLQALTSGGRKRYRMPDGSVSYLSSQQIQSRIKQAREQIANSCGPAKGE